MGRGRAWLEIDLDKLQWNIRYIKSKFKAKFNFVVKANAYGHGAVNIAKVAERDVYMFSVATLEEAWQLIENGIKRPILVFAPVSSTDILLDDRAGLIRLSLIDADYIKLFEEIARKSGRKMKIHIDVDTGMNRTGIRWDELAKVLERVFNSEYFEVEGIFTHFATAADNIDFARVQLDIFKNKVLPIIPDRFNLIRHVANTAALMNLDGVEFDMYRVGVGVYGLFPSFGTKQIMTFKSRVLQIKRVKKGEGIGYGHSYKAERDMTIAVVPVGYADGYPRQLSNKASVLIKGVFRRIVGYISMDLMMVDVSEPPYVSTGDEVVLIGSQGDKEVRIYRLASLLGTIPYELATRVGSRVPRIYV